MINCAGKPVPFTVIAARPFAAMLNVRLREEETAVRQIEALGFSPSDVRHIVITHLDFDHAGGLEDFPNATVHLMDAEFSAATGPRRGFVPRSRYLAAVFIAFHLPIFWVIEHFTHGAGA